MKKISKFAFLTLLPVLFSGCGQSIIEVTNTKAVIIPKDTNFYKLSSWTTKSAMITPRQNLAMIGVNNKLYAIGGDKSNVWLSSNEVYDTATDKWEQKQPMANNRSGLAAGLIGTKIYVIGGFDGGRNQWLTDLEVYDTATDKWEVRTSMLTARSSLGAAVIDNKLYAVGGSTSKTEWSDRLEMYNPDNGFWMSLNTMSAPRSQIAVATVNNRLYVFGGSNQSGTLNLAEEYNPKTNKWRKRADLPSPRANASVVTYKSNIFLLGGSDKNNLPLNTVDIYNVDTDTWSQGQTLLNARDGAQAAMTGDNNVYLVGGMSAKGGLDGAVEAGIIGN